MEHKSERYSVTLTPPSVRAIEKLTKATGLSKTDCINRATLAYAYLDEEIKGGSELMLRKQYGTTERVHIL